MHLLDKIWRDLARAEACHSYLRREPFHFLLELRAAISSAGMVSMKARLRPSLCVSTVLMVTFPKSQIKLSDCADPRAWLLLSVPPRGHGAGGGTSNPHGLPLEPKSSASTNSATPARTPERCAAYNRRGWLGNPNARQLTVPKDVQARGEHSMQQLPNEPATTPAPATPDPPQPGQPVQPPPETPTHAPDIDVPSPVSPGTNPNPGPISPVGSSPTGSRSQTL